MPLLLLLLVVALAVAEEVGVDEEGVVVAGLVAGGCWLRAEVVLLVPALVLAVVGWASASPPAGVPGVPEAAAEELGVLLEVLARVAGGWSAAGLAVAVVALLWEALMRGCGVRSP